MLPVEDRKKKNLMTVFGIMLFMIGILIMSLGSFNPTKIEGIVGLALSLGAILLAAYPHL